MPVFTLDRNKFLKSIADQPEWDLIVVGGGATGLGIAVDGASRGYKTLLLEQADFAKGTSSRSTKLVHGGVRYLAQGDIRLVYDALHERGILQKNAAHLVKRQPFIIPCYSWMDKAKYLVGLKLYDWLSGRYSFGQSRFLNKKELLQKLPGLNPKNLAGGVEYYDGQFDDARLAINLAQTAAEQGAVLLNYFKVTGLKKEDGKTAGVIAVDAETRKEYKLAAKVVINATGVFVDELLQMDTPGRRPLVRPSQGVHLVVDQSFLQSSSAVMIPKTADGRVLFAVPWHNHVLLGTTDTPLDKHSLEPEALQKEIRFILETVKQYLTRPPQEKDVLSVFAGLRPLAAPQKATSTTKEISRDHKLLVSDSGLITITGGKWTTYRKMAEETVNKAAEVGGLPSVACTTKNIGIHGCEDISPKNNWAVYGTDREKILALTKELPRLRNKLIEEHLYTEAEVVWAIRNEMARTVEDVLARRLRLLFLDAKAASLAAPSVAELMAKELGYTEDWKLAQIESFTKLAANYLLEPDAEHANRAAAWLRKTA